LHAREKLRAIRETLCPIGGDGYHPPPACIKRAGGVSHIAKEHLAVFFLLFMYIIF
jgi:hypothetical protein